MVSRSTQSPRRRLGLVLLVVGLTASLVVVAANARVSAGNPAAGKPTFDRLCASCHVLKAAGSTGTEGPNLNRVKLSQAVIAKAISDGGAAVMKPAQVAKYTTKMLGYKKTLTAAQIQDLAAYVYVSTH